MKISIPVIVAGLELAALSGGYLAGRLVSAQRDGTGMAIDVSSQRRESKTARGVSSTAAPATVSTLRSTDTLESLIDSPDYERLALWLLDASETEIAAFWNHHMEGDSPDRDTTELVMIAWSRLNPQGAIAAVRGTEQEHFAWWAWACHAPAGALETAIADGPERIRDVTRGIGEFRPKWLRENFALIPESARGEAMEGFRKWSEADDGLATLQFLKERGTSPSQALLKSLVRQDPLQAFAWFEKNATIFDSGYDGGHDASMNSLIDVLAESHPEVLEGLIEEQPSGARRRRMEEAAFQNLLEFDSEAALRQARDTEAPRIGAGRLARVALKLAESDPDRAFEIAADIFSGHPAALDNLTRVHFPNGEVQENGGPSTWSSILLNNLAGRDPARAMEMLESTPSEAASGSVSPASQQVARTWAYQDLNGFAQWVVDRGDQPLVDRMAPTIIHQLRSQFRFDEAMDWALGMEDSRPQLTEVFRAWQLADPDAVRQWRQRSN